MQIFCLLSRPVGELRGKSPGVGERGYFQQRNQVDSPGHLGFQQVFLSSIAHSSYLAMGTILKYLGKYIRALQGHGD